MTARVQLAASTAQTWIFTFGGGQLHPTTGAPLERRFLAVHGTSEQALDEVCRHFRSRWGNQYASREAAGVEEFGLVLLAREDWPARGSAP